MLWKVTEVQVPLRYFSYCGQMIKPWKMYLVNNVFSIFGPWFSHRKCSVFYALSNGTNFKMIWSLRFFSDVTGPNLSKIRKILITFQQIGLKSQNLAFILILAQEIQWWHSFLKIFNICPSSVTSIVVHCGPLWSIVVFSRTGF